jgi:hypothetical protein
MRIKKHANRTLHHFSITFAYTQKAQVYLADQECPRKGVPMRPRSPRVAALK